jgi:probable metal-binding protein
MWIKISYYRDMSTAQQIGSIHGHEVIHLIHEARPSLTDAELTEQIEQRFGVNARFHTCSVQGMTLPQLLSLLVFKNKVAHRDGRWFANIENVCGHGDDHHHHEHGH